MTTVEYIDLMKLVLENEVKEFENGERYEDSDYQQGVVSGLKEAVFKLEYSKFLFQPTQRCKDCKYYSTCGDDARVAECSGFVREV